LAVCSSRLPRYIPTRSCLVRMRVSFTFFLFLFPRSSNRPAYFYRPRNPRPSLAVRGRSDCCPPSYLLGTPGTGSTFHHRIGSRVTRPHHRSWGVPERVYCPCERNEVSAELLFETLPLCALLPFPGPPLQAAQAQGTHYLAYPFGRVRICLTSGRHRLYHHGCEGPCRMDESTLKRVPLI
jgi:hypothetical protein